MKFRLYTRSCTNIFCAHFLFCLFLYLDSFTVLLTRVSDKRYFKSLATVTLILAGNVRESLDATSRLFCGIDDGNLKNCVQHFWRVLCVPVKLLDYSIDNGIRILSVENKWHNKRVQRNLSRWQLKVFWSKQGWLSLRNPDSARSRFPAFLSPTLTEVLPSVA